MNAAAMPDAAAGAMRLVHYAAAPLGEMRSVKQRPGRRLGHYAKPKGLWVSVEGDDDWLSWCRDNDFGLDRLTHIHDVILAPNAKVLRISDAAGIDALTADYGTVDPFYLPGEKAIDWHRVATNYHGIIIAPFVWSRRLHPAAGWYYAWDCASGCLWDARAVSSVTLREVVPTPADAR